jgi:C1A family cysteine protease
VTPVRSQDNFSTCWIMAATGSLESAALTAEGRTPDAIDFSENNLANHMASRLDYEGRAPSELAAAYYARWEGPVWETSDPYPRRDGSPRYLRAVRHVQEVLFLPQRTAWDDNAAIKWAVMTYGGVDAAAYFHMNKYWNGSPDAYAYFSDVSGDLNHHILCVGWNDAYPADNFRTPPEHDGAFLIKNSWGTDFADQGYLWVSYCDVNFGRALAVFNGVESAANYDAVYQYDALGRSAWVTVDGSGQAWYASRFTSAGTGEVTAAAFYTPVPGTAYEVRVARTLQGIAAAPVAAAGTVAVGGYHTVRLQQPAAVVTGDPFVVAVRVTTPDWTEPVPVEAPSELIAPRARAGQSFVSADGSAWTDLTTVTTLPGAARANVCLKAFVDAAGAGDTRPPHVELRGGTIRSGARATIRWRLDDAAFSSGSAILELSVRSAAGKLMAHRRIPAVVVGERGVWNFTANWPQGRYSVRGRAYDVAGRRQATATRAAVIVRGVSPAAIARSSGQQYRR